MGTDGRRPNARLRILHYLVNGKSVWRQTELVAKVREDIPNGVQVGYALSRLRHSGVVEIVEVEGDKHVHLRLSTVVYELLELGLLDLSRIE